MRNPSPLRSLPTKPRRLTTPAALIEARLAPPERLAELEAVAARYAVGLTPALAGLMRRDDPADPIARQFIPDARELVRGPWETDDPIGDDAKSPVKGLVHRYPDRVLIKLVAVCAVYCRFCFRRERIGPGSASLSDSEFAAALDYVRANRAIWEVVLTGGDPLTLSPRRIALATQALAGVDHVRTLRWHTRLPVAEPERVTAAMARALRADRRTVVVALHANHPRELTAAAHAACRRLVAQGLMLVSQSVLLKGVNDDVDTLDALMRAFVEAGVKPYYLHHGDLAPGTAHWRVPIARGQELMSSLRARLSGVAMPTYVLDIPGGRGKVPVGPQSIRPDGAGRHIVTDPQGAEHVYLDRLAD
ncbi:MAG: lysine-2,3-aminomutase-like protein [Hyphomicrobiales bacterium]|nr:lysine-2,3-aminomutase-like protein [Hyphomicrobiales bacterium]MBV8439875.1 lysine-2,3-aminomutase-like protein [Hyphomicrobiales bacterium]